MKYVLMLLTLLLACQGPKPKSTISEESIMYHTMVSPVVKLYSADGRVGSGFMITDDMDTYILTCNHNLNFGMNNSEMYVLLFLGDGSGPEMVEPTTATIVARDSQLDVGLLLLDPTLNLGLSHAKLPLPDTPKYIFQDVVLVGGPMDIEPLPTKGFISDFTMGEFGKRFIVNAPAFYGNSGGPVFDAETYEVLGIFYALRGYNMDTVTHLSLVIDIDAVYNWLTTIGMEYLIP